MKKNNKRVLVADDNLEVLSLLTDSLTGAFPGIEIIRAVNGNEAQDKFLECFGENIPVAAILDFVMSGKNGLEIAAVIRGREETKNIPIVVISGFFSHSFPLKKKAEELNCSFLSKPVEPVELCNLLAIVLR